MAQRLTDEEGCRIIREIDPSIGAREKADNTADGAGDNGHPAHVLPPPSQPMAVARVFVTSCMDNGELTLRHWGGGWWEWRHSHWLETEDRAVRATLYRFAENAVYLGEKFAKPWAPTHRKIADLSEALAAICHLPDRVNQPSWLDDRPPDIIVACANGLLDVERRRLLPHSPSFFNQTSVPFDYDPRARPPQQWLNFLGQLWSTEPDAISVLAQWFGYVVSGRTDLHKILLMVGPTRGGKGVIARILGALIGTANCAGPTLSSLGGEFGLAPLIGKPLAIISDARFTGKNANIVVERLLSISGEDTLTVNRKYRDQWTGKLPSRLHVISNELPRLGDASTAIVGRIVLLLLSNSWLGREDHGLERALQTELTGILNWALAGLHRLTVENGNSFTRLMSADEAITAMRDLASPVAAFARELCVVRPDKSVPVDTLYSRFKEWCDHNGHTKSAKHVFGRDLRAAISSIRLRQDGARQYRIRVYGGIGLRSDDEREASDDELGLQ
jgi:putative DNA primase/helicase